MDKETTMHLAKYAIAAGYKYIATEINGTNYYHVDVAQNVLEKGSWKQPHPHMPEYFPRLAYANVPWTETVSRKNLIKMYSDFLLRHG
jgi:hypothetical protein